MNLEPELAQAAGLLATVAGQAVDHDEAGRFHIRRGVAKDRVVSTVHPEARHGRKSVHGHFDGYKAHVAVDPDTELITEVEVTAANVHDAVPIKEPLPDVEGEEAEITVIADSAYGSGPTRRPWLLVIPSGRMAGGVRSVKSPEWPEPRVINPRPRPRLISVVIPARNAARTLPAQLEALSGQEYSGAWEVIVADNGSTDGTAEEALKWASRLPSLRVVDGSRRKGAAAARNEGADAARGDLLLFCDADDVVAEGWLEAMSEAGRRCHVVGGALSADALNDPAVRAWRPLRRNAGLPRNRPFLPFASSANLGVQADVFHQLGGFREDYIGQEDLEFAWRAQLMGFRLCFAEGSLVEYRYRSTLRSLATQSFRYAFAEGRLFRDFRELGLKRASVTRSIRTWMWIVARFPQALVSRRWRGIWVRRTLAQLGAAAGAIRFGMVRAASSEVGQPYRPRRT